MPRDGTNLQDPVKMDRFGMLPLQDECIDFIGRIIKA